MPDEIRLNEELRLTRTMPYPVDPHWRDWLGSLTSEKLEEADYYILYERPTERPEILDGEHRQAQRSAHDLYWSLLLVGIVRLEAEPVRVAGSVDSHGTSGIRTAGELDIPVVLQGSPFHTFSEDDLRTAFALQQNSDALWKGDIFRRLGRILEAFHVGIHSRRPDFRLHQFVRCVEGFIAARQGDTKKRFKSRTELFVGPRHHPTMDRFYEVRSKAEHLHDPIDLYGGSKFERYLHLWQDA